MSLGKQNPRACPGSINSLHSFALASLILNLTPGPDMMYVLARSVAQRRRASVLCTTRLAIGG
jgi:threonine/homoserine/homoserine lactone efflux protein